MTSLEPTVRRQVLGAELRILRKGAGYTLDEAAQVINASPSKLSRIETGHRSASMVEVASLVAVYKARSKKRDELLSLAAESHEIGWWLRNQSDYARQKHTLTTLESKAETIVSFELAVVPGLLQTVEYTQAMMAEMGVAPGDQIKDRMTTRQRRRSVLLQPQPPELLAIIEESALHRRVGGHDVLRRQLEHLIQESSRPNVTLHVLPNNGPAHGGIDGSFLILRRKAASPVVFIDNLTSGLFIEGSSEVETYELALRNLLNHALSPEESVSLVAGLAERLDTEASNGWKEPTYAR